MAASLRAVPSWVLAGYTGSACRSVCPSPCGPGSCFRACSILSLGSLGQYGAAYLISPMVSWEAGGQYPRAHMFLIYLLGPLGMNHPTGHRCAGLRVSRSWWSELQSGLNWAASGLQAA